MLKMYQKHAHSGDSTEFWEETWENTSFNGALAFCKSDPLLPIFEKYAKPGMKMLEGGCGIGYYVTFHKIRGLKVIGLDFAQRTLKLLSNRVANLNLCAGNVANIPFNDKSFDVYYSGGVVEHFEDGAETSLKEARRILKDDGVLLISVPYQSPLRRLVGFIKKPFWKKVSNSIKEEPPNGLNFYCYAYKTREFEQMLANAGLKVIEKKGFSVIWGLYDLPIFAQQTGEPAAGKQTSNPEESVVIPDFTTPQQSSLLKRLVVSEDDTVPVLGLGVKFMRWFAGHMMMYVCVRNDSNFSK
jgi:ubiquinone/menaquinone biosynthesis C-methylase UbiE